MATRADGLELLPPREGSICRLEIPASFWIPLLSCPATCDAIMESVLWLLAACSSVVFPRATRLIISAVASGGLEADLGGRLLTRPRIGMGRLYCSVILLT